MSRLLFYINMAISEFSAALNQVATERGISVDSVLESIKMALVSAYRKDLETTEEIDPEAITVDLDASTGEAKILLKDKDVTPSGFGRIAAQTAKQVILQKIRETEKGVVLNEYRAKVGTLVTGHVFRIEPGVLILDMGKAQGIMPLSEQVESEQYRLNQRLKVLVKEVRETPKGSEVIVSRSDPEFLKRLFEQEVPEIASGVVTIEGMAREAGARTKMAVASKDDKVDPVGSCVGQKGVRVQAIIAEVFGEKIDIIPFSTSTEKFIAASLAPAKVNDVELDVENKRAIVSVPEDQQSLAIGKEGQNARLANKLTKWKIDIKGAAGLFGDAADSEGKSKDKKDVVKKGIWDEDIKQRTVEKEAEKTAADAEKEAVAGTEPVAETADGETLVVPVEPKDEPKTE